MVMCKKCLSGKVVKNGIIRKEQRYICRECGRIFVEGVHRVIGVLLLKKPCVPCSIH